MAARESECFFIPTCYNNIHALIVESRSTALIDETCSIHHQLIHYYITI